MGDMILLQLISDAEDGKFYERETGEELTIDEAIKVVQDIWRDMPQDYYSWDLMKVVFKDATEHSMDI